MIKMLKSNIKKMLAILGYEIRSLAAYSNRPEEPSYQTITRFLYFKRIFDMVKNIDGDIVECGVGGGNSLLMLAFLVKTGMKNRKLWGFDSFKGFPEPLEQDRSERNAKKGEWENTSPRIVRELLLSRGLDSAFVRSQVILVKGLFNESLPKYRGDSIALLHLDVDLYDSYRLALKELYPKVVVGGVVLFDEYLEKIWPGAQKAIDEYFGNNKSSILKDGITGKYYVIKNKKG